MSKSYGSNTPNVNVENFIISWATIKKEFLVKIDLCLLQQLSILPAHVSNKLASLSTII